MGQLLQRLFIAPEEGKVQHAGNGGRQPIRRQHIGQWHKENTIGEVGIWAFGF